MSSGKCIPADGCYVDTDCDTATHFCHLEIHTCVLKLTNNSPVPDYRNQGRCSAEIGIALCESGVCDADNRCGYLNGDGPCTPTTPEVCRSTACSMQSSKCVPAVEAT